MARGAVGVDLLFVQPGPPEGDAALAAALRAVPSVVASAAVFPPPSAPAQDVTVIEPIPLIGAQAQSGLANLSLDPGGTPRFAPLLLEVGGATRPHFALLAAALYRGVAPVIGRGVVQLGETRTALDRDGGLTIRYRGPAGAVATVSAAALAAGTVPDERIRNKLVLIGATANAAADTFATPFDSVVPGVEVLASAVATLLTGQGLERSARTRAVSAGAGVVLAGAAVLLFSLWPAGPAALATAALLALWAGVTLVALASGWWLEIMLPFAGALPPAVLAAGVRLEADRSAAGVAQRSVRALRAFQPPELARRLMDEPGFLAKPEERDACVLFVDLNGFTGLAEVLGAQEARDLIGTFQSLVEEITTAQGGMVTGYAGDGAMILFGLFGEEPDHAARTLEAALALRAAVRDWIAGLPVERRPLGVKLGAHAGPVVVSRLGHETHRHITAIGDAVNVASRLMELAKGHGSDLCASEALLARAGPLDGARCDGRFGAPFEAAIRGRTGAVKVRCWVEG